MLTVKEIDAARQKAKPLQNGGWLRLVSGDNADWRKVFAAEIPDCREGEAPCAGRLSRSQATRGKKQGKGSPRVDTGRRRPQRQEKSRQVCRHGGRCQYDNRTEITGHGFRAMARTILHEELHQQPEVIEHQLAHSVSDALGTAYNRTKFLKERRAMMQTWVDYLDKIKAGAEVIRLREHVA